MFIKLMERFKLILSLNLNPPPLILSLSDLEDTKTNFQCPNTCWEEKKSSMKN